VELLIGALFGVLLERATSFLGAAIITFRHRRLRGSYTAWSPDGVKGGTVIIRPRLGNSFVTRGTHDDPRDDWTGSFQMEDMFTGSAHGVYRHVNRDPTDWGNHYLMLLDNGDIAAQWHNVSHGWDRKGRLLWKRDSSRVA